MLACCWHASNSSRPRGARYIEAFSGSAALFFRVRPRRAVLVDVNGELQECFARVRNDPTAVHSALSRFSCSEQAYYRIRSEDASALDPHTRAARFIYLNRLCFNGLYRTNSSGKFNVPYGGSRNGSLPTQEQLHEAAATLNAATLITGDFYASLSGEIGPGDFVYMDPPYARRNADLDNQYGPDVFGLHDIERLELLASSIAESGAHFVISYADCREIRPLAKKWTSHRVTVKRTIAADVNHRGAATELLITNM